MRRGMTVEGLKEFVIAQVSSGHFAGAAHVYLLGGSGVQFLF